MGAYYFKQPNGLYGRFSTVVDAPTHYNFTKEDLIEEILQEEREELSMRIDRDVEKYDFEDVLKDSFNLPKDELNKFKEVCNIPPDKLR